MSSIQPDSPVRPEVSSDLTTIQLTKMPMALDPDRRRAFITRMDEIYSDVFKGDPGTARINHLARIAPTLSLMELSHFQIAVHCKQHNANPNLHPIAPISTQLYAAELVEFPKLLSAALANRLIERVQTMSRRERADLIRTLAVLDGWSDSTRYDAPAAALGRTFADHLRYLMRQLRRGDANQVTKAIVHTDPVRTLEAVRFLEERLSPSFVFAAELRRREGQLSRIKDYSIGYYLASTLRSLFNCQREFESLGLREGLRWEFDSRRCEGHLETVRGKLMCWRGEFKHSLLKWYAAREYHATMESNAARDLFYAFRNGNSELILERLRKMCPPPDSA